mmetsp:Transcript_17318/g.48805  ORF Transcript_17318/g.48805 Transcript_17318/m.48805 type:complete len:94 (-) Transcript_17318:1023-1304(-)
MGGWVNGCDERLGDDRRLAMGRPLGRMNGAYNASMLHNMQCGPLGKCLIASRYRCHDCSLLRCIVQRTIHTFIRSVPIPFDDTSHHNPAPHRT